MTNGERHTSMHMIMLTIVRPILCLQGISVGNLCIRCSTTCKREVMGTKNMTKNAILGSGVQLPRKGTYWQYEQSTGWIIKRGGIRTLPLLDVECWEIQNVVCFFVLF